MKIDKIEVSHRSQDIDNESPFLVESTINFEQREVKADKKSPPMIDIAASFGFGANTVSYCIEVPNTTLADKIASFQVR